MLITELIHELELIRDKEGNIEVCYLIEDVFGILEKAYSTSIQYDDESEEVPVVIVQGE